jgi:hypothetical protein
MNIVLQNIFTDGFLSNYNLKGNKEQKQLIDLQICMLLAGIDFLLQTQTFSDNLKFSFFSEIWTEANVSREEFYKSFRYCIRLAHNRCYRVKSNKKLAAERGLLLLNIKPNCPLNILYGMYDFKF